MKRRMKVVLGYTVFWMMAVVICSGSILIGKGYDVYREAIETVSLEERVADVQNKELYASFEKLPETYVNAVVAVEDKRFFKHSGIDPIAICRAVIHDIRAMSFVEGGSTITQQLAKNLYFSQEKELTRKIAEVFVAFDLEKNYSKDEIFELYVNSIYFGNGYYGIAEASEGYFEQEPEEMSEYESTLLAGVPNAPSVYAPTKNPDLAAKRQLQVLHRMEVCGYFSEEDAETVAETLAEQLAMNQ